jgi:tRNA(fMet)-specific endonuclease VapC
MVTGHRDYLLDTNILASLAAVRGGSTEETDLRVERRFEELKKQGKVRLFISAITVGESEYGLLTAPTANPAAQKLARQVIDAFPGKMVLGIDRGNARFHYASLRVKLFNLYAPKNAHGRAKTNFIVEWKDPTTDKVLGINENDVWIASLALAHNLTLASGDKMTHIRNAAGEKLSYENWEQE